jgi:hypothetical protein
MKTFYDYLNCAKEKNKTKKVLITFHFEVRKKLFQLQFYDIFLWEMANRSKTFHDNAIDKIIQGQKDHNRYKRQIVNKVEGYNMLKHKI